MSKEIKITLPYPPSANRYWRNWNGRMVLSAEARQYKLDVAALARALKLRPSDAPCSIELKVYRPIRRGDLSNRIKIVEDALQGVAYIDDAQIEEIRAYRFDDKKHPRVEVTIILLEKAA